MKSENRREVLNIKIVTEKNISYEELLNNIDIKTGKIENHQYGL